MHVPADILVRGNAPCCWVDSNENVSGQFYFISFYLTYRSKTALHFSTLFNACSSLFLNYVISALLFASVRYVCVMENDVD